eukprot:363998-Chlamydomonas_euryale.AAC.4
MATTRPRRRHPQQQRDCLPAAARPHLSPRTDAQRRHPARTDGPHAAGRAPRTRLPLAAPSRRCAACQHMPPACARPMHAPAVACTLQSAQEMHAPPQPRPRLPRQRSALRARRCRAQRQLRRSRAAVGKWTAAGPHLARACRSAGPAAHPPHSSHGLATAAHVAGAASQTQAARQTSAAL